MNKFYKYIVLLLILFTGCNQEIRVNPLTTKKGRYCYDGDTCYLKGGDSIRLTGINAPEIKGKCEKEIQIAIKARDYINDLINKAKYVEVSTVGKDKYGRQLGSIYIDGQQIQEKLIDMELAVIYPKRKDWCK